MTPYPGPPSALLEPSLAAEAAAPLLSPRASFLTSFFGGPFAALVVYAVNAGRLGRTRREAAFLALIALVGVAALAMTAVAVARPDLLAPHLPDGLSPNVAVRRGNNLLGLAGAGLHYLRLGDALRAAVMGAGYAKPWKVVGLAFGVVTVLHGGTLLAAYLAR